MNLQDRLVRHPGNQELFFATEMSIVASLAGRPVHLHAEGLRGTGKTTILRSARNRLPRIERVKGCLYNCHPDHPHCPEHRRLGGRELEAVGTEWVPMPFLEISHSAKIGTVVGSIDLARIADRACPEADLLPGTIPQAHRGIIFVDEINRLAETSPELADVLLDVMGTKPGRVQIEETGLPAVELPVQVSVWAASNPDEEPGPLEDIRRQLSDRFDFTVSMSRPGEAQLVEEILERCECDPWSQLSRWAPAASAAESSLRAGLTGSGAIAGTEALPRRLEADPPGAQEVIARAARFGDVAVPASLRSLIASIYIQYSIESLRAAEAMYLGSKLSALLDGRSEAGLVDLRRVAVSALRHRVDLETLSKVLRHLEELGGSTKDQVAGAGSMEGAPRTGTGGYGDPTAPPGAARDSAPGKPDFFNSLVSRIRLGWNGVRREGGSDQGSGDNSGGRGGSGSPGAVSAYGSGEVGNEDQPQASFAPPGVARAVRTLTPDELVKSEEDLRGR